MLIMGRGLGVERIMLSFLRIYTQPEFLVLVLGASDTDQQMLVEELGVDTGARVRVVNNECPIAKRKMWYLEGGTQ